MDDDVKEALDALKDQLADLKSQLDALNDTIKGEHNLPTTEGGAAMNEIERLDTRIELVTTQLDQVSKTIETSKNAPGQVEAMTARLDEIGHALDDVKGTTDRVAAAYLSDSLFPALTAGNSAGPIVAQPFTR